MRTLLGFGLVLALACGVTAAQKDEKIDAKKLVGKWEREPAKEKEKDKGFGKVVVEYTADGKVTATLGDKGDFKLEGTYKVDGNKITQTMKFNDKETSRTVTVLKLTDEAMETEDEKGAKNSFKRLKAEKKKD